MLADLATVLADGIWVGGSGVILFIVLVIVLIILFRRN